MNQNAGLPKNPGSVPVGSQGTGQITINLNRGLKGLAEGLAERLPAGRQVMNGGLREVINRAIDQNPETPNRDFTAVELAEHLGIIESDRPRIAEAKPRRRKR